jgi:hypothetical protein
MGSVHRICRRQWVGLGVVALPALAVLALALAPLALAGCGTTATDPNEPNDEPNSATVLAPGKPAEGVIGANDSDVFQCVVPEAALAHPFVVTVRSDAPQDIELQVGASIPGAWEGISWPGWQAVTKGDSIEVAGELRKGTVLVFLKGATNTAYTVDVTWK